MASRRLAASAAATTAVVWAVFNLSGAFPIPALRQGAGMTCEPAVMDAYALPSTKLDALNPWLSADVAAMAFANASALDPADCHPNHDILVPCYTTPGVGSGLARLADGTYVGLTDRGPNQDCEDLAEADPKRHTAAEGKDGKGFYLPTFSPTLIFFNLTTDGKMLMTKAVPLRGTAGERVTGLSNTVRDDTPYGANCVGEPLALDVGGVDPEDVAVIPGTDLLAVVEEYSPSVMVVHGGTGVIQARYVPASIAPMLAGAPYPVVGSLPSVFADRRKNRGFESLSVAPSGAHLYAILQSPLGDKKADGLKTTAVVRAVKMRIEVASRSAATLTYDSQFALEASLPAAWTAAKKQPVKPTKVKLSAAVALADDAFVLLERAPDQVLLYRVDVTAATTNLDATAYANGTALELQTAGATRAAAFGVTPAAKRLLWNSAVTPSWDGVEQQEGLAVDGDGRLLIISDNDFGIEDGETIVRRVDLGRGLSGCDVCPADAPTMAAGNVATERCGRGAVVGGAEGTLVTTGCTSGSLPRI